MSFSEDVKQWAADRNLIEGSTSACQLSKLMEEYGELATAVSLGQKEGVKDGIGDINVVLEIICAQEGIRSPVPPRTSEFESDLASAGYSTKGTVLAGAGSCLSLVCAMICEGNSESAGEVADEALGFLCTLAENYGMTLEECQAFSWDQIKDRKGRLVDGVFIKEEGRDDFEPCDTCDDTRVCIMDGCQDAK